MSFFSALFGGGKKSQAPQVNAAAGLQVQTSVQGKVVALVYGTTRIAPNLVWYGDFVATQVVSSGGGGGGKGGVTGGGGKGGGGSVSYTYSTSFELGLCEGPISTVWSVYVNKNVTSLAAQGMGLLPGFTPQTPWGYLIAKSPPVQQSSTIPGTPFKISVAQSSAFLADGGVVKGNWMPLSLDTSYPYLNPGSGQYAIQNNWGQSIYYFNAAQAGQPVLIQYKNGYQFLGPMQTFQGTVPALPPYAVQLPYEPGVVIYQDVQAYIYGTSSMASVGGAPGVNQYNVSNGVYTFNSANAGQGVTITYYTGTGNGYAIGYSGTALVVASAFSLGNNPQLPNFNFEVLARFGGQFPQNIAREPGTVPGSGAAQVKVRYGNSFISNIRVVDLNGNVYVQVGGAPAADNQYNVSGAGIYTFRSSRAGIPLLFSYAATNGPDVDPATVVYDLLTSTQYGIGFPLARVGSFTIYQAYAIACGLLISPAYTDQVQASSMLDDIAKATNSEFVWSAGLLTIVPYGDQNVSQFGYSYVAPTSPVYSLGDDDFMPNTNSTGGSSASSNDDPVLLTRLAPAQAINAIQGEFLDCGNSYNPAMVEAKDLAAIQQYGLRQDSTHQIHLFCNVNAAKLCTTLQLYRQAVRNQYSFTLDQRYVLLDPMDIVAISDSKLGLINQWVRLLEITENDDGTFSITAEEYLQGTGHAPAYTFQDNSGFQSNYNVSPGNANTPIIFEPPIQATASGGPEAWIGVSGGQNFGGAQIYISTDGSTFKLAGQVNGSCRMGVLTQGLFGPALDPDTSDALVVNLQQSNGQLISGTQNDADNFHTLSYVGTGATFELMSYETAALVGVNTYALTYLRRGVFGTTNYSHPVTDGFMRLDDGVFKYTYDKSKIGQTIYVKICAFNTYQGAQQGLSDVTATPYLLVGPPLPGQVQGFQAQQTHDVVAFNWVDLPNDVGLKGYDIAYGAISTLWSQKQLLTEAARGTEMTNASVPPGLWEFSIRGHDLVDHLSPLESKVQLQVTNTDQVILDAAEEPSWLGSDDGNMFAPGWNLINHYMGTLAPMSMYSCDNYQPYQVPVAPTLTAYTASGAAGTYYIAVSINTLSGETTVSPVTAITLTTGQGIQVNSPILSGIPQLDRYVTGWSCYGGTSPTALTLQGGNLPINSQLSMGSAVIPGTVTPPRGNSTGYELFDIFVPDPYNNCFYPGLPRDTGLDATNRVYFTYKALPGPGESGIPYDVNTLLSYWLTGGSPSPFLPFILGFLHCRFVWGALQYIVSATTGQIDPGNVCYFTDFSLIVDDPPATETNSGGAVPVIAEFTTTGSVTTGSANVTSIGSMSGIAVGQAILGANIPIGAYVLSVGVSSLVMSQNATGNGPAEGLTFATFILFPTPYHFAPVVQVTPVSGTAQSGTATNLTNLGFTPLLWNGTTNVSGSVNWSATGQ